MRKIFTLCLSLFLFGLFALPVSADTTSTLLPTSDGNYLQFNTSSGSTHYTLVDESSCNGNTDFNRETTTGQRDSYGVSLSSIPSGSQITQIALTPCASKNTNGGQNTTMNVFYRLNGVNSSDAGGYTLTTTTPSDLSATSFSSLSTIKTSSTTLESGAVFTAGNRGLKLSRLATVITYTPFATPSGLSASPISTSSVQLNWSDNSTFESGYRVERSLNGVSGWTQRGSDLAANSTSYTDTGLTQGTTYYYRVYAFNSGGNSAYSNLTSVNTGVPLAPTNVILTTPTCGVPLTSMNLSWTDNAFNESGFSLQQSLDGINYTDLASVGASITSHDFTGTECDYRIRSYNGFGVSTWAYVDIIQ